MSSKSSSNGPTPWSLGGEPPEPQIVKEREPVDVKEIRPADTHTGTDPLGRAIGPREDHTKVKKVFNPDGEIVAPYTVTVGDDGKEKRKPIPTSSAEARVRKTADATDTKAEDDAGTKPYTPGEVAAAHAAGDVIASDDAEK